MQASIFSCLSFFLLVGSTNSICIPKYGACDEDCDCCNYGTDPAVKCEIRHRTLGRRCYISGNLGRKCYNHDECKSQWCEDGFCRMKRRPHISVNMCPLTFDDVIPIDGLHPVFPTECVDNCEVIMKTGEVEDAVDGDLATAYVNDRAINSGLLLYPKKNAPLKTLKLCSASDCPECDPKCYKLEGFCSEDNTYNLIKEENFSFTARGECVTFNLPHSSINTHYKLTFPCHSGPSAECSMSVPNDCTCSNGIVPFIPDAISPPATCNGVTTTDPPPRTLEFISSTKIGAYTEIVYRIEGPGPFRSTADDPDPYVAFKYAVLQWDNNCCFDCYGAFIDVNGDGVLQQPPTLVSPAPAGFDEPCSEQCDSVSDLETLIQTTDDPNLCMEGIKLMNPQIVKSQTYFFTVRIAGDVTMVDKPYGIYSQSGNLRVQNDPHIAYGIIKSPVCSCEETTTGGDGDCVAYPLQIAEIELTGKCNQLSEDI